MKKPSIGRKYETVGTSLFKRLTKLFSGPIVNYRTQAVSKYRRKNLNKFKFTSTSGKKFKRYTYDPFANLNTNQMASQWRFERYQDFEQMEYMPELASALDIYADEITTFSMMSPIIRIKCKNYEIKEVLDNLFYNILNVEFNLFYWVRSLCKFGDFFLFLDVKDGKGIRNVIPLPQEEIERLEGQDSDNPLYIQFQWNSGGLTFENFQIAHFRLLGNDKYSPYGTAVLDPARRIWRQLCCASHTPLWTKDKGYKQIKDIHSDDIILSYDFDNNKLIESKVKECRNMGKQRVIKVVTSHRQIEVTPNHGLLVYDKNGKFVYKQAKDLIVSDGDGGSKAKNADKLVLPNNWETTKDYYEIKLDEDLYFGNGKIHKKSFLSTDHIFKTNPEFMRLFGFMLGDGWINEDRKSIGFALGIYEEQNQYYINLMESLFSPEKKMCLTEAQKNKGAQVNISSKECISLFKKLGFISGFENKRIPSWVYSLSKVNKIELLRGLMDADGSKKDKRLSLSNYELMNDVQILCQQCGVAVGNEIKLSKKAGVYEDKTFGTITRKDSYRLYINLDDIDDTDISFENVSHIIDEEKLVDTYDLQVDNEIHNFVANGIVSHNTMLEDAVMSYRIVRSPERRVFYLDMGGIPAEEEENYVEEFRMTLKKNQVVDHLTGRVDQRYSATSIEDDYIIPVRGKEDNTKIETLAGGSYTGDVDDIKYFRDKMFSAIKIPASYLTAEAGDDDKSSLSQKDIRFARTIQRLQNAVVTELEKVARIHLAAMGYKNADLVSYEIILNNPSKISELQEIELWKTRFDAVEAAKSSGMSTRWVDENIKQLSSDEQKRIRAELFADSKLQSVLEGMLEGGSGDMGAPISGSDEDLLGGEGDEDSLGGEGEGEEGGGEDLLGGGGGESKEGGDEDETLLAAPGRRSVGKTSLGKYKEHSTDKEHNHELRVINPKHKEISHSMRSQGNMSQRPSSRKQMGLTKKQTAIPNLKNMFSGDNSIFNIDKTNYPRRVRAIFEQQENIDSKIKLIEKLIKKDEEEQIDDQT
ncbi:portal protein [Candidatus Pacearchaeota archaeon]|nr:portal protein [Candidatus Pacearchaeota archaeon]